MSYLATIENAYLTERDLLIACSVAFQLDTDGATIADCLRMLNRQRMTPVDGARRRLALALAMRDASN